MLLSFVFLVLSFVVVSSGQRVCLFVFLARAICDDEIELREELRPASLSSAQLLVNMKYSRLR